MARHTIVLDLDDNQELGLAYAADLNGVVDGDAYLTQLNLSATSDYYRQSVAAKVMLIGEEAKLGTADVISDVDATAVKAQAAKDAREAAKEQEEQEEPVAVVVGG